MRDRPYIDFDGYQLMDLFDSNSDEFEIVCDIAYELQFRRYVPKEAKARVIEMLIAFSHGEQIPPPPDFPFPTTDIVETRRQNIATLNYLDWQRDGLLSLSGYRVGHTNGKPEAERRKILNYIFLRDELQDVDDRSYAAEWGQPMSTERLKKLAWTIAKLAQNASRNSLDMTTAISEWEEDLEYIKHTFYDEWHNFPWPDLETWDQ